MSTKKISKVVTDLIYSLENGSEVEQLKALVKVRSKGSAEVVPAMFNLYSHSNSVKIKAEIEDILGQLKVTKSIEPIVEELSSKNELTRQLALRTMWHSGLDFNEHIDSIIQCAANGSFMEAFEALTIIENLNPPLEEEIVLNSLIILKEYFGADVQREEEHFNIMKNITIIMKSLDESLD